MTLRSNFFGRASFEHVREEELVEAFGPSVSILLLAIVLPTMHTAAREGENIAFYTLRDV